MDLKITVVGLGSGSLGSISLAAYEKISESDNIFLRTRKHPICEDLEERGIEYSSFDEIYNQVESFSDVYNQIVESLINEVKERKSIVYAVPGHPRVAESSVDLLLAHSMVKSSEIEVEIISSNSFLDDMFVFLNLDPVKNNLLLLDALDFEDSALEIKADIVFSQVYDWYVASELKIRLLDYLDDETDVIVFKAAGIKGLEEKLPLKLYEIDRPGFTFDHLTSIYIPYNEKNKKFLTIKDLTDAIARLRGDKGCPWDKMQTSFTIMSNIEEEIEELRRAIENEDIDNTIEELGDVLMLLAMQAQFGAEEGYFDMKDVIDGIVKKLIFRHPHIFEDEKSLSLEEANDIWEKQKIKEKSLKA